MRKTLTCYDSSIQTSILPKLRLYFDKVTYENRDRWIMQIWYADKSIFESFETYEQDSHNLEQAFEEKKLRLFLDGVYLYYVHSNDHIELVCDAYDDYYKYR
jgi:hypothetical protein